MLRSIEKKKSPRFHPRINEILLKLLRKHNLPWKDDEMELQEAIDTTLGT